ncbi:hypothetical protein DPMN_076181 [Dreissena polymorpha]|uniref:Uncharacterized protein n=1 Tax=Dreissena polymorpha TaxID=45954 RepID=A0A9D3YLT8_DREPO|nr:hypothetical protein DPMN_076181 [Dreissena polymorpha]
MRITFVFVRSAPTLCTKSSRTTESSGFALESCLYSSSSRAVSNRKNSASFLGTFCSNVNSTSPTTVVRMPEKWKRNYCDE